MSDGVRELVVEADGGSRGNPGPAGYGALVRDAATGTLLAERAGYLGVTTNNVAEYTGLLEGLRAAATVDPGARVHVRMDSRLVVEQMTGTWQIKHEALRAIAAQARSVLPPGQVDYTWIPRAQNSAADALANEAMDTREPEIVRDFPHPVVEPVETTSLGSPEPDTAPGADTHYAAEPALRRPPAAFAGLDPADATTLILVRHGVTPLTLIGGYSGGGVPGPPLTSQGRTQAARAADAIFRLAERWPEIPRPSQIVASPTVRTKETAAAVGRRLGLHVRTDSRLRECEFGEWESLTSTQIEAQWPGQLGLWHSTGTFAPPGGESSEQVGVRVAEAVEDLCADGKGRSVVVVGHAAMIRTVVGRAMAAPPSHWSRLRIPPASLSILRIWDEVTEVTAVGLPA